MVRHHDPISSFPEVTVEAISAVAVPTTGSANEGRLQAVSLSTHEKESGRENHQPR